MYTYDDVSRLEKAPSLSAGADNLGGAPTSDRPSLVLSSQVKVPESEEVALKDDPSQMIPLIKSMKTCHCH